MNKDIDYFIKEEISFQNEHPDYGESYYDMEINEMSEVGIDDRMNYLSDGIFSKTLTTINEPIGQELQYGLTIAERVMLRLFYCQHSYIFKDNYYTEGITEFITNLFDTMNSVVLKAPLNNDSILYRYCDHDPIGMQVGECITIPYNLTCTNYEWHQDNDHDVYIIKPLQNGNTKAHNLFMIYNHGYENQVNFLRNTVFLVKRIEFTNSNYKKYHLEEQG